MASEPTQSDPSTLSAYVPPVNIVPQPWLQQQSTTSLESELQVLGDVVEVFLVRVPSGQSQQSGQKVYDIISGNSGQRIFQVTYNPERKSGGGPANPVQVNATIAPPISVANAGGLQLMVVWGRVWHNLRRLLWTIENFSVVNCLATPGGFQDPRTLQQPPLILASIDGCTRSGFHPMEYMLDINSASTTNTRGNFVIPMESTGYTIRQSGKCCCACGCCGLWCQCVLTAFQIKKDETVIGEMKMKKVKFWITFPPQLPLVDKATIMVAGLLMNKLYFEKEEFPACCHVGSNGKFCTLVWCFGALVLVILTGVMIVLNCKEDVRGRREAWEFCKF